MALAPAACRDQPEGTVKVVVIGGKPRLRDPALGPLPPPDAVLLANVAQGLVRFDATGQHRRRPRRALERQRRWPELHFPPRVDRLARRPQDHRPASRADPQASLAPRSDNPLKDTLGAVDDIVAMTDRVIEIRLKAPRPNLLPLLAQPEFGIVRNGYGTGPFQLAPDARPGRRVASGARDRFARRRGRPARGSPAQGRELRQARRGLSPPARPTSSSAAPSPTCRSRSASKLPRGACASTRRRACSAWSRRVAAGCSTMPTCAGCSARRSTATR